MKPGAGPVGRCAGRNSEAGASVVSLRRGVRYRRARVRLPVGWGAVEGSSGPVGVPRCRLREAVEGDGALAREQGFLPPPRGLRRHTPPSGGAGNCRGICHR